ncbi:unnamed protein product [Allacma fusca]|uniref:Uncharacterized protein n=1 Tax=Allacma fusca TaxID=39272 RepID=A0A8J2J9G1_9HEXA|nr:unnamed protein product [Allacma fusca]
MVGLWAWGGNHTGTASATGQVQVNQSQEHHVSSTLGLPSRRPGGFPDPNSILSPRTNNETGGLGVKMVEYVLGTSPATKDLDARMRHLAIDDKDKKDLKKEVETSIVQNGMCEEIVLQHGQMTHIPQIAHCPPHQQQQHGQMLQHPPQPLQHPQLAQDVSIDHKNSNMSIHPEEPPTPMMTSYHPTMNGHSLHHNMANVDPVGTFAEIPMDPTSQAAQVSFESSYNGVNPHMVHPHQPPPNVLPPFDQQQIFRTHNGPTTNGNASSPLGMVPQQYLQQQQQIPTATGLPSGSGFTIAPYVINSPDQYSFIAGLYSVVYFR